MEIFNSNGSIYNFYPNLPKIFFIQKMSKNKVIYLIRFPSYVTRFFFSLFQSKVSELQKIAMTSQFHLTRFYDVIIGNSVFQHGNFRSLYKVLRNLVVALCWNFLNVVIIHTYIVHVASKHIKRVSRVYDIHGDIW